MSVVDSRKPDQYVIITSVTMKTGQSQRDSADQPVPNISSLPLFKTILALTEKKQRFFCLNFSLNFDFHFLHFIRQDQIL